MFASNGGFLQSINYYKLMIGITNNVQTQYSLRYFINSYNIFFIALSILVSLGIYDKLMKKIDSKKIQIFDGIFTIIILLLSLIFVINNTYVPSLYSNF